MTESTFFTFRTALIVALGGLLIDRLGRRPLLVAGLSGIVISMLLLSYGFGSATYSIGAEALASLPQSIDHSALALLVGQTYDSDTAFRGAVIAAVGGVSYQANESALLGAAISINPALILIGMLGFVASFAMSLGPVMWVLFSELFSNRLRGVRAGRLAFDRETAAGDQGEDPRGARGGTAAAMTVLVRRHE
jgi:hypothetical protein